MQDDLDDLNDVKQRLDDIFNAKYSHLVYTSPNPLHIPLSIQMKKADQCVDVRVEKEEVLPGGNERIKVYKVAYGDGFKFFPLLKRSI